MPSWQLVGAVLGVDIIATIIAIFGWLSGAAPHNGHVDIVTVVRVWAFSLAVIVVLTVVYFLLNQWKWLNNLGALLFRISQKRWLIGFSQVVRLVARSTDVWRTSSMSSSGSRSYMSVRNRRARTNTESLDIILAKLTIKYVKCEVIDQKCNSCNISTIFSHV
jgi:hypothetical protein